MSGTVVQGPHEVRGQLRALREVLLLFRDETKSTAEVLSGVAGLLPGAGGAREVVSARVRFGREVALSEPFVETAWREDARFATADGQPGSIEIFHRDPPAAAGEGALPDSDRVLIESLAEMLRTRFQHQRAHEVLRLAHADLARLIDARTEELRRSNDALHEQVRQHQDAEHRIAAYQRQLRDLASQLSLSEARERRAIAEDLHDHVGQALSFIKLNISQFRGNAIFCGFESEVDQIMSLLDQTIRYTRSLTVEISPPVLYELGLPAALDWLAERFHAQHGLRVTLRREGVFPALSDDVRITLMKCVQELLTNVVKHAHADRATLWLRGGTREIEIEVTDEGRGFDPRGVELGGTASDHFGLFSIRERLGYLGGRLRVRSARGSGTSVLLALPAPTGGAE